MITKRDFLSNFLFFFLAAIVIGMGTLVDREFLWSRFLDPVYWEDVIMTTIANVLVLTGTTNLYVSGILNEYESDKEKHKWWHRMHRMVRIGIDNLKTNFDKFIGRFNLERKERAYRRKVYKRLAFWEFFASERALRLAELPDEDLNEADRKYRRKNWFYKKKRKLEAKLNPKLLDRVLPYKKVKYSKIKGTFVKSGYNDKHTEEEYDVESAFGKMARDHAPTMMMTTGLIAFVRSFQVYPGEFTWAFLVTIVFKVTILVVAYMKGKRYAPKFVKEKIVRDLQTRLDIMLKYFDEEGEIPDELYRYRHSEDRVDSEGTPSQDLRRPKRTDKDPKRHNVRPSPSYGYSTASKPK